MKDKTIIQKGDKVFGTSAIYQASNALERAHIMANILKHHNIGTLTAMEADLCNTAWRQCGPNPNQDIDLADMAEWRDAIKTELERRKQVDGGGA